MTLLVRHPHTPPGAIHTVDAELRRVPGGAVATFRAIGDTSKLVIPRPAEAVQTDGLWKTTCFELFAARAGAAYTEFNLSPSGAWAAYDFDRIREGMRITPASIAIETELNSKSLTIVAQVQFEFPCPSQVGLTAVIEEADGTIRYWSTAFGPGKPDFHTPAVRSLLFDGIGTE